MLPPVPLSPAVAPAAPAGSARARQDVALVQAALGGSEKAYADLVHRHHKALYHAVLKMVHDADEAQDLAMETFGKAFRHLAHYRPEYAFSTWLFRIGANHCLDFLRRNQRRLRSLRPAPRGGEGPDPLLDVRAPDLDPQEACVQQQQRDAVQRAVARLPAKYRRLVELHYFQELSYEEIAAAQRLPLGTVKAQLFRARGLLLPLLQPQQPAR